MQNEKLKEMLTSSAIEKYARNNVKKRSAKPMKRIR
jgi:hypothetical protein